MTVRSRTIAWLKVSVGVLVLLLLAGVPALRLIGEARLRAAAARFEPLGGTLALPPPPAPRVEPERDAATWLTAGAGAIVLSTSQKSALAAAAPRAAATWSEAERSALAAALGENRAALDILHRAAGLETGGFRIDYSAGIGARVPNLLSLLTAARLLAVEAREAMARGDDRAASTAASTLGRLAAALESEPALIAGLIGTAAERSLLAVAADAAGEAGSRNELVEALERAVPGVDLPLAVRRSLAMDARAWVVAIRAGLDPATGKTTVDSKLRAYLTGDLESAAYLDFQRRLLEATARPQAPGREGGPPALTLPAPARFAIQTHNLTNAIRRFQATAAQRQLVLAALALRREAGAAGAYPAARPAGGLLSRPDPFTGRLLAWDRKPDGSLRLGIAGGAAGFAALYAPHTSPGPVEIVLPAPAAAR